MPSVKGILIGVLAIAALVIGWWLASPLFLDQSVDEAFPLAARAIVPDSMTRDDVERLMSRMAESNQLMSDAMPSADPVPTAVKSGRFRDADNFHRGAGTATVYRLPAGDHVLRLEDFDVTNGPDLRVLLSPHPDPMTRDELNHGGYIELSKLKGNLGSQNYEIPADIDVGSQQSVIIYCRPFHVIFSVAPLGKEVPTP